MTLGPYRYRLKSTGFSSQKFGPCEVCGQQASEVFLQAEEQLVEDEGRDFWTRDDCHTLFGHEHCLVGARRVVLS